MKKWKFGLIGCGRISIQHIKAIKENNCELVAISDIIKEKAEKCGKENNCEYYTDNQKIYDHLNIDVICITTPNGTHTEIGLKSLRAGKHVLLEKPLALNLDDVDKLIKTSGETGKNLFSVMQVRYNPAIIALKKFKDSLGKINQATLIIRMTRPQEYFKGWRGTKNLDGGSLINQGIHSVDIMQWVIGSVKSVYAITDTMSHKIEIEDAALAILKFENGAYGLIEFTLNTYPKNMECSLTVLGENGTVKIGGKAINEIEFWDVKDCEKPEIEPGLKPNVYANGLYQGSCPNHTQVYKDLIYDLENNTKKSLRAEDAKDSLRIILAIYESAKTGKEVFL
ncbi:oxidoreductase [archaeon]|nr:oxidoreductase [archaeon]|tara:strand:+ start:392 stop:1408 length:1017 start_codon:yes stop_codon:yes gene_type:complete